MPHLQSHVNIRLEERQLWTENANSETYYRQSSRVVHNRHLVTIAPFPHLTVFHCKKTYKKQQSQTFVSRHRSISLKTAERINPSSIGTFLFQLLQTCIINIRSGWIRSNQWNQRQFADSLSSSTLLPPAPHTRIGQTKISSRDAHAICCGINEARFLFTKIGRGCAVIEAGNCCKSCIQFFFFGELKTAGKRWSSVTILDQSWRLAVFSVYFH